MAEEGNTKTSFEKKVYWFVNGWRTVRIAPEIFLNQQIQMNEIVAHEANSKRFLKFLLFLKSLNVSPPTEPDLDLAVDDLIASFEFHLSVDDFKREKRNLEKSDFDFSPLSTEDSQIHPDWKIIDAYLMKWADGKMFAADKVNWNNSFKKQSLYRFLLCIEKYIMIPKGMQGNWYNKFASQYFTIDHKPISNLYDVVDYVPAKSLEPFKSELYEMNKRLNSDLRKQKFELLFT